jgi:hypothetical protein
MPTPSDLLVPSDSFLPSDTDTGGGSGSGAAPEQIQLISNKYSTDIITSPYRFELARSSDFFRYGDLTKAKGRSLTLALNKAGSFSFTMPLESNPVADDLEEISTCVLIYFQDELIWSGPVWTIEEQTPNTISVGCVGWYQVLEKRIINPEWCTPYLSYVNQDAGVIALDLLARTNTESPSLVVPGTAEETQLRTRNYSAYGTIANEIQSLSTIEAGFDLYVDPETRLLNIYSSLGVERIHVNFEYGTNVLSASRRSDSSKLVNKIYVYGGSGTTTQVSYDPDSIARYGLHEEAISLSDVTDNAILAAFGQAELAVRANPLRLIGFEPRRYLLSPRDPLLFQDFNIGDTVYATIQKERFDVSRQAVRVFGATMTWDDAGNVQLTAVQTTAQ